MRIVRANHGACGGFTLVELLVVILAIAILSALAIPALGRTNQSAELARDIENARSIAALAQGAEAAGVSVVDPDGSVMETIRRLSGGVTVTHGVFQGKTFQVSLGEDEIEGAARLLRVENGLMVYLAQ